MAHQTITPAAKPRRPFTGYEQEGEAYAKRKDDLLVGSPGSFVVFVGGEMIAPFDDHESAERAGYSTFGLGPLFIKQVLAEEPVLEMTRLVAP